MRPRLACGRTLGESFWESVVSEERNEDSNEAEALVEEPGSRSGEHKMIWVIVFGLLVVTLLLAML